MNWFFSQPRAGSGPGPRYANLNHDVRVCSRHPHRIISALAGPGQPAAGPWPVSGLGMEVRHRAATPVTPVGRAGVHTIRVHDHREPRSADRWHNWP